MSYAEKYKGYRWIKVPHFHRDPSLTDGENLTKLEQHHVAETTFLIREVRRLAALLDGANDARVQEDDGGVGTEHS
jgi:hypothetical protein